MSNHTGIALPLIKNSVSQISFLSPCFLPCFQIMWRQVRRIFLCNLLAVENQGTQGNAFSLLQMRVIIVHLGSSPGACSSWKLWPGLFWAKHCLNSSALLTLSDPPGAQSLQALDHSGLSAILTSYLVLLASLKTPHCTIISTSRNHPSQTVIFWVPVIQRNKKSGSSQSLS